eukprot:TRINITY_DN3413_c0_g1_i2.p1 TRINITY_DN3413_c0_g1~~TRINITY_DN3413_c0_g1_i2.p1  ORF type:complete len:163 (-),score=35.11 TRINITY_DN3413_c0_g1_i2:37-525(-)
MSVVQYGSQLQRKESSGFQSIFQSSSSQDDSSSRRRFTQLHLRFRPSDLRQIDKTIPKLDSQSTERLIKIHKNLTTYLHLVFNEPSIGLFHIQNNIQDIVPKLKDCKLEIRKTQPKLEQSSYDVDDSIETLRTFPNITAFDEIQTIMDACSSLLKEFLEPNK